MKKTLMALALALVFATPTTATAKTKTETQINARCAAKWGTDFRMQKYCRKKQIKGMKWILAYINRHKIVDTDASKKRVEHKILFGCWTKWSDKGGQDWPMIAYCVKKQTAAYNSLR